MGSSGGAREKNRVERGGLPDEWVEKVYAGNPFLMSRFSAVPTRRAEASR
jgi:hypothetical protein